MRDDGPRRVGGGSGERDARGATRAARARLRPPQAVAVGSGDGSQRRPPADTHRQTTREAAGKRWDGAARRLPQPMGPFPKGAPPCTGGVARGSAPWSSRAAPGERAGRGGPHRHNPLPADAHGISRRGAPGRRNPQSSGAPAVRPAAGQPGGGRWLWRVTAARSGNKEECHSTSDAERRRRHSRNKGTDMNGISPSGREQKEGDQASSGPQTRQVGVLSPWLLPGLEACSWTPGFRNVQGFPRGGAPRLHPRRRPGWHCTSGVALTSATTTPRQGRNRTLC